MRVVRSLVVLLLVAGCTSHPSRPAPTAAPGTPSPVRTVDRFDRRYAHPDADLLTRGRHTLVASPGVLRLVDDSGRTVSSTAVPAGDVRLMPGGFVVVQRDGGGELFYSYEGGRLRRRATGAGRYPPRFMSGLFAFRQDGGRLLLDERARVGVKRWALPKVAQLVRGAPPIRGDEPAESPGEVLAVTMPSSGFPAAPVVAVRYLARCAVLDLSTGRRVLVDPAPPYGWAFGLDAAVDQAGAYGVLVQESGAPDTGTRDAVTLYRVDVETMTMSGRVAVGTLRPASGEAFTGHALVALPGGLVAYLATAGGAELVDLRGPAPVVHPLPADLGDRVAAAGEDAVFVYGAGGAVARVTVSTGEVLRDVPGLHAPGTVSAVVRVL